MFENPRVECFLRYAISAQYMKTGSSLLLTHHLDNRHYHFSQFENGLRVIFVEDPTSEVCNVAATVGNGHFIPFFLYMAGR